MRKRKLLFAITAVGAVVVLVFRRIAARILGRRQAPTRVHADACVPKPHDDTQKTYVFLHGLHGSAYEGEVMHRHLVEEFGNYWTLEMFGHGETPPAKPKLYDMYRHARTKLNELDNLMHFRFVNEVVGIGHSYGGGLLLLMALISAARGRQVFSHLVLYEPIRTGRDLPFWMHIGFDLLYWVHRLGIVILDDAPETLVVEGVHQLVKRGGRVAEDTLMRHESDEVRKRNEQTKQYSNARANRDAWMRCIRAYLKYDGEEVLADFPSNVRVTVVQGELTPKADRAVTQGEKLVRQLGNARLITMQGVAHQGLFRRPSEFIDIVRRSSER